MVGVRVRVGVGVGVMVGARVRVGDRVGIGARVGVRVGVRVGRPSAAASTFEKTDSISARESSGHTCWKAAPNSWALRPSSGLLFRLHCSSKLA